MSPTLTENTAAIEALRQRFWRRQIAEAAFLRQYEALLAVRSRICHRS